MRLKVRLALERQERGCCGFVGNKVERLDGREVAPKEEVLLHNSVYKRSALETVLFNTAAHLLSHRHKASRCCCDSLSHFDVT